MAQRVPAVEASKPPASRVRVAVRLRPYMNKHDEKGEGPCVRGTGPRSLEIINWRNATETLQYQFDVFHGEQTTQQEVFLSSVKPILPHVLNGQNASVFAYGPTGAGKTHTMLGGPEQPGVIPRAVQEVFKLVRLRQRKEDGWDYAVDMSYLEIYNEKVLDLLSPGTQDLPIREDKDRNILIPGLTRTPLTSFAHFDSHFVPASLNRTTASTKLNQRSSRSHAVLLIQVVRTQRAPPLRRQTGKLYLVDLAGSEDNRRTGNQGLRLKESGAINLSLFTLSKVVDALNAGGGGRVPYRDSKLTRLLQDSLGGSAHSVMITNIAPEYHYYFDTFTALNFAAKSKQIVNRPFVRETVAEPPPGKRSREDQEAVSAEPLKKKLKAGKSSRDQAPARSTHSPSEQQSVLDRLIALERKMTGSSETERLDLLKTIDQSRKEIQELKEQQRVLVLESRARALGDLGSEAPPLSSQPSLLPPLHRKPAAAAKPRRQQAVVQPLQGSSLQNCPQLKNCPPLQISPQLKNFPPVKKTSVCLKKERLSDDLEEKENVVDWASQMDGSTLERCRLRILELLNSGSLRELKDLQKIGQKKAQLILGWREIHGRFAQVEDLTKIEGIGAKTFSSFMKANILSEMAK